MRHGIRGCCAYRGVGWVGLCVGVAVVVGGFYASPAHAACMYGNLPYMNKLASSPAGVCVLLPVGNTSQSYSYGAVPGDLYGRSGCLLKENGSVIGRTFLGSIETTTGASCVGDPPPFDPQTGEPLRPPFPDDPVWPDDWQNHPDNPCGGVTPPMLPSSGGCSRVGDFAPPGECDLVSAVTGGTATQIGTGKCTIFRPDASPDALPADYADKLKALKDASAADKAARAADLEQAIADEIASRPDLHPYDGKVADQDGQKEVAVGEGCGSGGGCQTFKFDAAGNLVGGTQYPPASGPTLEAQTWEAPPGGQYDGATGALPSGATTAPATVRLGTPHPWVGGSPAPSQPSPPVQPIKTAEGTVVGGRSTVTPDGVVVYRSGGGGGFPTVFRNSSGAVCTGTACGYDPSAVGEDGTIGGGGTGGDGNGGDDGTCQGSDCSWTDPQGSGEPAGYSPTQGTVGEVWGRRSAEIAGTPLARAVGGMVPTLPPGYEPNFGFRFKLGPADLGEFQLRPPEWFWALSRTLILMMAAFVWFAIVFR